jgi:hypothetical protein
MCCNVQLMEEFYQIGLEEFSKTYLCKEKYHVNFTGTFLFVNFTNMMILLFGKTYMSEQIFSRMKHIKSRYLQAPDISGLLWIIKEILLCGSVGNLIFQNLARLLKRLATTALGNTLW